jgi:hypothetical protein
MDNIIQPPPPFQVISLNDIILNGLTVEKYNTYVSKIINNNLWEDVDKIVIQYEIGWFDAMISVCNT